MRSCYEFHDWARALDPNKVGAAVDYQQVRDVCGTGIATEMHISTNASVTAIVHALRGLSKQAEGLVLASAVAVEKLSMIEGRLGASGFQDEGKKIVGRVMAAHQLRTGRVVPCVPFQSSAAVEAVFRVTGYVQKVATVILANIPWSSTFPYVASLTRNMA